MNRMFFILVDFWARDTYLLTVLGRCGDGDGEYRTRNAE